MTDSEEVKREYNTLYSEVVSNRFMFIAGMIGFLLHYYKGLSPFFTVILIIIIWAIGDGAIHFSHKITNHPALMTIKRKALGG